MTSSPPQGIPQRKSSGCLKALLLTVAVLGVLIVGGVYFVSRNLEGWLRSGGGALITEAARQFTRMAQLDSTEEQKVIAVADKLAARVSSGDISLEQALGVIQQVTEGPLLGVAIAQGVEVSLPLIGVSGAELETGRQTCKRFAYGLLNRSIDAASGQEVLDVIGANREGTEEGSSEGLTPEEARRALSLMKQKADAAQVPEQVPPVPFAEELSKAIDTGLTNPVSIGK